jgi:hypothetical protein
MHAHPGLSSSQRPGQSAEGSGCLQAPALQGSLFPSPSFYVTGQPCSLFICRPCRDYYFCLLVFWRHHWDKVMGRLGDSYRVSTINNKKKKKSSFVCSFYKARKNYRCPWSKKLCGRTEPASKVGLMPFVQCCGYILGVLMLFFVTVYIFITNSSPN